MTIRLIITYLLNLFDLVMTNYWIGKYGLEIEANPVGRWLYSTNLVYLVKIFGIGILLIVLNNVIKYKDKGLEKSVQWWDLVSWILLTAYGLLSIYHVVLFYMYQ